MFRGRSRHTLDSKGRLAIPARFREVLEQKNDGVLVVTNHEKCLWAYAREDWREIEEKAAKLPQFSPAASSYLRVFISGAVECPVKQGRITLPPNLRTTGGLNKDIMLVGELIKFEIWDKDRWEAVFQQSMATFSELGESLTDLGI